MESKKSRQWKHKPDLFKDSTYFEGRRKYPSISSKTLPFFGSSTFVGSVTERD